MKVRGRIIHPADLDAFLDNVAAPKKTLPLSMYYSEGVKHHQSGQYDLALKNYEVALQLNPASLKTLLKRCRAYIEIQEYSKAREDAMAALKYASSAFFSEACDLKGRCEYLMGDFEEAFLTFYRGKQLCPGSEKLRLGGQLCEEAMRNSMLEQSEKNIGGRDLKILLKRNDRYSPSIRDRYSDDKKMFEKLLDDEDMKYVHGICRDGLKFVEKSDKFWRMQKPQRIRKRTSPTRRQFTRKEELVQHTVSVIRRCRNYLQNEMASLCVSEGQKLMLFFESHPDSLSNSNIKFKADLLHLLGLAYEMEMKDRLSMNYFEKELKVAQTHNLAHSQMRAFHHLGRRYLRKGKMRKACRCLSGIREVLNSKRIKNYFNESSQSDDFDKEEAKGDRNTELAEVHAARVWAQHFKSELSSVIQDAIITPAEYLLLDIYEEEMRTVFAF